MEPFNCKNTREAVILHTVEDAKDLLYKGMDGKILLSTNPSVDFYLRYESRFESTCLSTFLTFEEIKTEIDASFKKCDAVIRCLDESWSCYNPCIAELSGIKLFDTLYSFVIRYMYAPYRMLVRSLEKAVCELGIRKLFIYDLKGFSLLGCGTTFSDLLQSYDFDIPIETLNSSKLKKTGLLKMAYRAPDKALSILFEKFKKKRPDRLRESKPTLLVYESLYDIDTLVQCLDEYNILYYKNNSLYPETGLKTSGRQWRIPELEISRIKALPRFDQLIVQELIDHFNREIGSYADAIVHLDKVNDQFPIVAGISGNAATYGFKPLVLQYLRKNKIPVAISQHGFNYGIQDPYGMHIYSDFNRCDYFLSYGFGQEHLDELYKDREEKVSCRVMPFGSTRLRPNSVSGTKRVDILYPLMNTISMFHQGLFRIKPELLAWIQEQILLYLDSKKDLTIIVKPFLNYNSSNCAVIPVLKRLKNVRVMDNIHFSESFSRFKVKAVLIDHISSPIAEAIPHDVEIFALGSDADKIQEHALDLMRKRVHYEETVEGLLAIIDQWIEKTLPGKRDTAFMETFLLQEDTEHRVKSFVTEFGK